MRKTLHLRWIYRKFKRVLQQLWVGDEEEWRDVPLIKEKRREKN